MRIMVDNADWLLKLGYIEMLREVGRHFSVNRMLTMDSVKLRLEREQEMSFIEFNYMVCQSYDYVELARRYGCQSADGRLRPVGQHRQRRRSRPPHGHAPALRADLAAADHRFRRKDGQDGAGRGLAQCAEQFSAWDFWQYWRNTEDADVVRFLKLFTTLPMDEIARLEKLGGAEINEAKKVLANEATALLHGRKAAEDAAETARKTFEEGSLGDTLPTVEVPAADLKAGIGMLSLFVDAGLAASNGEMRRHVKGGAVRVNDEPVSDERMTLDESWLRDGVVKLSLGKKKHALVKPV
jgi:tyrosyl-tRNA synthetase